MQVLALKPFLYSPDGIRTESVVPGERREIRDDIAPGLIAAGYVRAVDGEQKSGATFSVRSDDAEHIETRSYDKSGIAIPDDWQTMKWFALKALAKQINGDVSSPDQAKQVIRDELARRARSSC